MMGRLMRPGNVRGGHSVRPSALAALGVAMVLACLALFASSALAAQTHPYTGLSFGPDGASAPGEFGLVTGVTVDQSSGDVYVLDASVKRIYKFDSGENG